MSGKRKSLNARIRNLAKGKNVSPQELLKAWAFQRFLLRLAKSVHKDRFVLKGGFLVAAWIGVERRTTIDIDVMVRNMSLDDATVLSAIRDICSINIGDDVSFEISRIEYIRDDNIYGGFRVFVSVCYDGIKVHFSIDISTDEVITPEPHKSSIRCPLDESNFAVVWTYPIETVLAEKVETILSRGIANTRARDFYDIFILTTTQCYDMALFKRALRATVKHRESTAVIGEMAECIVAIESSRKLKMEWEKYRKRSSFSANITYEQVMTSLKKLCELEDIGNV